MPVRVVLADDAPDLRELLRLALEKAGGFSVVAEAADGEAAIRAAREHQPDVLLLDISMPLLDGLDAIPEIRRVAPRCVVAVLSGYSDNSLRDAALRAGAGGFLVKGMLPRDLIAALRALVAERAG